MTHAASLRCGTVDPVGFVPSFYVGRADGRFSVVQYEKTTRCFTVVRSFDGPESAARLLIALDNKLVDSREGCPSVE